MADDTHFIGIDWGSTNARALLFAPDGRVVEEREEPLGIIHVPAHGHRAAFERLTADWRERHGPIPALLSGMIGSAHGWIEVPYVRCPMALGELPRSLVPVPGVANVFILPGLSLQNGRSDVMRGEELQLLGLGERSVGFDWVCVPGTHSKWARAEWPAVREFSTAMTGEMFSVISAHTLFAKLIPVAQKPATAFDATAFESGLERSASPHGLLNVLFGIRADLLLGRSAATALPDLISGLLIGTEIRHILPTAANARVALLAAPGLQLRYLRAFAFFGIAGVAFDVTRITADGFAALLRAGLPAPR